MTRMDEAIQEKEAKLRKEKEIRRKLQR
jgi:hypothetical protein